MTFFDNAFIASVVAVVVTFLLNLYKNSQDKKNERIYLLNSLLSEAKLSKL